MDEESPDRVGMYASGRARLLALGRPLSGEQARRRVPATPLWSVHDNFAHMAGVAADVLAGNVQGVATDPWTQAQVDRRSEVPTQEVLDELEDLGDSMDDLIAALGRSVDPRLFLDQWTHEQDIRGALGIPGGSDIPVVAWGGSLAVSGWIAELSDTGLPPLRVRCGGRELATSPDATAVLDIDPFTALRVVTGRRSAGQMAALHWTGTPDPSVYFEHMVVFSIAQHDIHDAL